LRAGAQLKSITNCHFKKK